MKLESKTALITGGASGIGKATALCFAREGAEVAIADLNLEEGKNACIEIEKLNRSALAVEVDVADEESVQHSVHAVLERFGKPDEVASAALFLCSSDASYITGQTLAVDGGFLAAGQIDRTLPSDSN